MSNTPVEQATEQSTETINPMKNAFDSVFGGGDGKPPGATSDKTDTAKTEQPQQVKKEEVTPEKTATATIPDAILSDSTTPKKDDTIELLSLEAPRKGGKDWKILRDYAKEQSHIAEQLKQQLEEARKSPATGDELKAEREARLKLEKELEVAAVERSAGYRAIVAREKSSIDAAKAYGCLLAPTGPGLGYDGR